MSPIPDEDRSAEDDNSAEIVDEYLRRLDAGENPDVEEYAARYPEIAAKLRTLIRISQGFPPSSPEKPIRPEPTAEPVSPAPSRRRSWWVVGLLVLGAMVAAFVVRYGLRPAATPPVKPPPYADLAGTRFVPIAAGRFEMGETEVQIRHLVLDDLHKHRKDKLESELPRRTVDITRPFYLGQYEVTVGEFREFVTKTGYRTELEKRGSAIGWVAKVFSWKNPGWVQPDNHPVVNVSWNDANAYCRWKTEQENVPYRLPTEAEWEYVCSVGGRPAVVPGKPSLAWANVADLSLKRESPEAEVELLLNDTHPFTAPVGSFPPNALEVYDITGNVLEWCSDWHSEDYQGAAAVDPVGPQSGRERAARGGSWFHLNVDARTTSRNGAAPESSENPSTGFRVVREIPNP